MSFTAFASTDSAINMDKQVSARERSYFKGIITRIQNQIKDLMWDLNNVEDVRAKVSELENALRKFHAIHKQYHSTLSNEIEIKNSRGYYACE